MIRGRRGGGSVFRKGASPTWVIQYYVGGRRLREYTGLTSKTAAQEKLTKKLAEIASGDYRPPDKTPVRVDQLYKSMLDEVTHPKEAEKRWKHLGPVLGYLPAKALTTAHVADYRRGREAEEAAVATINRELACLRRMLKMELERTPPRIERMPVKIKLPKEDNARTGFLAPELYVKFASNAKEPWLRAIFEVAYRYGWRRGELLGMHVRQVDSAANVLRLEDSKNGDGREVTLTPTCRLLLLECAATKRPDDFLFTRADGKPVKDFRDAWRNLCIRSGVGQMVCRKCDGPGKDEACLKCKSKELRYSGLTLHDLRRTAVRNMVRSGVTEKVAMTISGHKTRSVFDATTLLTSVTSGGQ